MTAFPAPSRPMAAPAQLTNMRLALQTMLECQDAEEGSPRMGLFYGFSGFGKSVAAATVAARLNAAYVVANPLWTQRSLLEAIAAEIGISSPARTSPRLLEQIIAQMLIDPQPIIVDEFDYLVTKKSVEIIRAIHDGAGNLPILMIGEEALPAKLKAWERFDNRILVATPAQPASMDDAQVLRDHYCPKVRVADDLVEAIVRETKGVTRRVVTNLQKVQAAAIVEGFDAIDLARWGTRRFATGDVALRRAA